METTQLNFYTPHPLKAQISKFHLKQFDLAKSLQISQPSLSKMLSGIVFMPEQIESEIETILDFLKDKELLRKQRKMN